jgi:LCP family protein required for cell wall assembly
MCVIVFLMLTATVGGAAWRLAEVFFPSPNPDIGFSVSDPRGPSGEGGEAGETGGTGENSDDRPAEPEMLGNLASLQTDPVLSTVNVLLVGLDDLDGVSRSDAIALAVFDQNRQTARVLSIPRDSRVLIPDRGWDKVNHAYVYGGISLLRETLIHTLNVGISYFVVLNYQNFTRMVDLIGGVEIDVEKKLQYTDYSGKLFINIPKGRQHMSGKTALEYVRFRHDPLGDIGRVQRQQKFTAVVLEKIKSPSLWLNLMGLAEEFISAINTNLTPLEGVRLLTFMNSLPRERIQMQVAPGKASYIGNTSYWILDPLEISKWLAGEVETHETLSSLTSADELPADLSYETLLELVAQIGKIGVLNGDGTSGLGRKASQIFQKIGVDVVYTGNAKHFDYYASNVLYPENAGENGRRAAEALAKLCGITNTALIQRDRTAAMVSIVLGHDKETIFSRLEKAVF